MGGGQLIYTYGITGPLYLCVYRCAGGRAVAIANVYAYAEPCFGPYNLLWAIPPPPLQLLKMNRGLYTYIYSNVVISSKDDLQISPTACSTGSAGTFAI